MISLLPSTISLFTEGKMSHIYEVEHGKNKNADN